MLASSKLSRSGLPTSHILFVLDSFCVVLNWHGVIVFVVDSYGLLMVFLGLLDGRVVGCAFVAIWCSRGGGPRRWAVAGYWLGLGFSLILLSAGFGRIVLGPRRRPEHLFGT